MAIDWEQINNQFEGKITEKKKKGAIDWEQINQRFAGVAKPEVPEYGTWQLPNQPDTAYSGIKKFGSVPVGVMQKSFTTAQPMSIAPTQKEGAFPRTEEAFGIAAQSIYKTGENPLSVISKPSDWWVGAKQLWENTLKTIPEDNLKRIADFVDTYKTPTTTAEKTGKGIEAAMVIPHTIFGAITGLFAAAEKIPTLKPLADIINVPFVLGGEIGSKTFLGILEKLPFEKQTKDYLYKGIDEVGSITGMIATGGAIHGTVKSLNKTKAEIIKEKPELKPQVEKVPDEVAAKLEKDYGKTDAKTIIERAAEQARLKSPDIKGLITAPKEKYAVGEGFVMTEKVNKQKVEISNKLNTYNEAVSKFIEKPTTSTLKKVQSEKLVLDKSLGKKLIENQKKATEKEKTFIPKIEKEIEPTAPVAGLPELPKSIKSPETLPAQPRTEPIKTEAPKEISKPAKVAKSIEAKSIEKGLTESFKDLAEYTPVKIKEQAKMMSDIMSLDIARAERIATGKEPLPEGLRGATAIKAMEDYAMETKNGSLAAELARSPLVSETSIAGQTLRLTAERTPDSAVAKIKEVAKIREAEAKKKAKGKSLDKIEAEIKKSLKEKITKKSKLDWQMFVDKITC